MTLSHKPKKETTTVNDEGPKSPIAAAPVWTPQKVDDVMMAFPADVRALMPKYADISEEFKGFHSSNKWVKFQEDWFFGGLAADLEFTPKKGIDPKDAWRHLQTIQGSYQPKHEHKAAAVAYLASLWFEKVKYKRADTQTSGPKKVSR